jgi:hypothetical protein
VAHWTDGRKRTMRAMGAQVRNCHPHRSRAQESLKLPMAQGQNNGVGATSPERGRGRKLLGSR